MTRKRQFAPTYRTLTADARFRLDQQMTDSSSDDEIAALSPGSIAAAPDAILAGFASPPEVIEASVVSPDLDQLRRNADGHTRMESSSTAGPNFSGIDRPQQKSKHTVPQLSFTRVKPSSAVTQSLLTSLLAAQSSSHDNPFSELYASVAAKGSVSYSLSVYFPRSKTPLKPLELVVQPDASVEEVIGYALWTYWEEKWQPPLDSDVGNDEEARKTRLGAVSWNLRIAEDDGEVDEDFPCELSRPLGFG